MTQMGAYIKRTKKDINPEMPNHSVESLPVDIDMGNFNHRVQLRMQNYRDKDLAISQMIAQRIEAAIAKVPSTLDMAKNILMQDKKVLIFTCFIEPAERLTQGLEKIVNSTDIGGGKVEIVVGNVDKDQVGEAVARFKDPNGQSKAMVLSILKGGTGIDLPNVVEDVLINDFSWTPKDAEQSEGRAFRISSTSDVTTTYIVAQNSPDLKMFDFVQKKKDIAAKIQNLEKKEMEYVLKGLKTTDLQKERAMLLEESKRLDMENQQI
jgi:SNF2 family DNA or RNA helicase